MSYILFVNPTILIQAIAPGDAAVQAELLTATALAAVFGCLVMGVWGRLPIALAPGMGLNAYFTYSVVLGSGLAWQTALGAVFISGLLFAAISLAGIRKLLIEALPQDLKHAITAGIGLFLATIGLVNGGMVIDHPATLVTMGQLVKAGPALTMVGVILTAALMAAKVRGAVLIGILATTLIAILSGAPVFSGHFFFRFPERRL